MRGSDERLGLNAIITDNIMENWRGKNTQLPLPDLLRKSIQSRLTGYEDPNDSGRIRVAESAVESECNGEGRRGVA